MMLQLFETTDGKRTLPLRHSPVHPPGSNLRCSGRDNQLTLAATHFETYRLSGRSPSVSTLGSQIDGSSQQGLFTSSLSAAMLGG